MTLKESIIEMKFKNADKMLSDKIIKIMRTEDLRKFYLDNERKMLRKEKMNFEKNFFGKTSGNEFLVERNKKQIKFLNFED